MTVATIEASEQDSQPRELIDIVHGTVTYRLTFAVRDVADGGNVYKVTTGSRGELGPSGVGAAEKELTLTLPIDHALPRRYLASGIPPKKITVTIRRKYFPSGDVEQIFTGEITSMGCNDDGTRAIFRVLARAGKTLLRVIPNVTGGRTCPHPLYGTMCKVARGGTNPDGIVYQTSATVLGINGREVRVDLSNVTAGNTNRANWAENGELTHTATGETMTVTDQKDQSSSSTVTVLTLEAAIYGLQVGDAVVIQAGCDKSMTMCNGKFGNRQNFGGFNKLPTKQNIHVPQNVGITTVGEF